MYGLTAQLRRAAVSVPANIAEGCGRPAGPDRARFFQVALGSASELDYLLELSRDLAFLDTDACAVLLKAVVDIKKMLPPLIRKTASNC